MSGLLIRLAVDILIVAIASTIIGVLAPRIPDRWLDSDRGLLRMMPWESVDLYRGLEAVRLARILPEAGALFGGESKSELPGLDREALVAYAREVRRAECVHIGSALSGLLAFLIGPWQLALLFLAIVCVVNGVFLVVLRHNRLRIQRILDRRRA